MTLTKRTFGINEKKAPRQFISVWKTDNPGASNNDQITLPLTSSAHHLRIDWGDGNVEQLIGSPGLSGLTHTYSSAGVYEVKIDGIMAGWDFDLFNYDDDEDKIIEIKQSFFR